MFERGKLYSRRDIHDQVGGSVQTFLPHVEGRVVAACLRADTNPDAPKVILPGKGSGIEHAAELLAEQQTPVPTFLRRAPAQWEYVGDYRVESCSRDLEEIARHARRSGRSDVTMVIRMTANETR